MNPPFAVRAFRGMRSPTSDFEAVRDDLQIAYLFDEIDLGTARSIAAGTHYERVWKGNSIYVDQQIDVGNATMVFHDPAVLTAKPGRMFVQPGFNAFIPFDRIVIENLAQPGKVLRFFYGVDIDFKPGVNGTLTLSGTANVLVTNSNIAVRNQGITYGASIVSIAAQAANTPITLVAPGTNVNGVRIEYGQFAIRYSGVAAAQHAIIAKTSAPASVTDGDVVIGEQVYNEVAGPSCNCSGFTPQPVLVAAGKGIYDISSAAETTSQRSLLFTVL